MESLRRKAILVLIIALNLSFLDCTRKPPHEYYISFEEIEDTIEIVQVLGRKDPNITIYLSNEKDSVAISILSSEIRTVRRDKKNEKYYTSFSSLDSVIDILAKGKGGVPLEKELPIIYFVDSSRKGDEIKIIPARQKFIIRHENLH